MKLFIGSSSRNEIPMKYYGYCKEFLDMLFQEKYDLVFGACGKGLMGLSYNVALNNYDDIIGIYPEVYKDEVEELQCIEMPVKSISERTDKVIEQSDALIFLPGGIGTVYELFTAIESKRAKEHDKPIIIYNCCDFYNDLLHQFDKMYDEKFTSICDEVCYYVCASPEQAIDYLKKYNKNKILGK